MITLVRFGSEADICTTPAHVRFGPIPDIRIIEEQSTRFLCRTAGIGKYAAQHLAPGGEKVELNAPPLCSTGKQLA